MVCLYEGRVAEAESLVAQAMHYARVWGGSESALRLDQATIVMAAGRPEEARAMLEQSLAELTAEKQTVRVAQGAGRLADVTSALADREATAEALRRAEPLAELEVADRPCTTHLTRAGRRCAELGWTDLARKALVLALPQWERLGDEARVAEVKALVDDLSSGV
jgi:hypothetical protein